MIDDDLLDYIDDKWCLDGVPFDGVSKSNRGNYRWYKDGRYHREDGPAVEWINEYRAWYTHGELHREDGPARAWDDGSNEWWVCGYYITTWKDYHRLSTLSPQEQMIIKLKYGEHLS